MAKPSKSVLALESKVLNKHIDILIPSDFDLIQWADYLKKLSSDHKITFLDRPQEEWAQDPYVPQTKQHFEEMLHHLSKYRDITCDIESSGLSYVDPNVFICGHVFTAGGESYYVPIRHVSNEPQLDADYVNKVLAHEVYMNRDKVTTWHNAPFDYNQLRKDGIDISWRFREPGMLHDTQIMMWLVDENLKDDENYYILQSGKPAKKTGWIKKHGHSKLAKSKGAVLLQGYSLKTLAPRLFGLPMTSFEDLMERIGFHRLPIHFGAKYARLDGYATEKVREYALPIMEKEKVTNAYYNVEIPYALVIGNMTRRGLGCSQRILSRIRERAMEECAEIDTKIRELAGTEINWSSGKQVGELLYGKLGYPVLARTPKGAPKTDAETMEALAKQGYELPILISRRNKLMKAVGTYVDGMLAEMDVDGRIHSSLLQTNTTTGRLASAGPNLQNLPAQPLFEDELNKEKMIALRKQVGDLKLNEMFDFTVHFLDADNEPLGMEEGWEDECVRVCERWFIRDAFTELDYLQEQKIDESLPAPLKRRLEVINNHEKFGTLDGKKIDEKLVYIVADYNQMELRMMAHFSKDPTLIDGFKRGQDIHKRTASIVYQVDFDHVNKDQRKGAKAVNFGLIYGKTSFGFAVDWYSKEPDFWVDVLWGSGKAPAKKYLDKAQGFIDRYFEGMPLVREWMEKTELQVRTYGYVRTITGRKRRLPDAFSTENGLVNRTVRQGVNSRIQGSSADFLKIAQIRIEKRFEEEGLFAYQLVPVHDEIITVARYSEKDKVIEILRHEMENAMELVCPIKADPVFWYRYGSA